MSNRKMVVMINKDRVPTERISNDIGDEILTAMSLPYPATVLIIPDGDVTKRVLIHTDNPERSIEEYEKTLRPSQTRPL